MSDQNKVELPAQPPKCLRLKAPPLEVHQEWLESEVQNYVTVTRYLAFFLQARSRMDDMTGEQVWTEVERNVSMMVRANSEDASLQ